MTVLLLSIAVVVLSAHLAGSVLHRLGQPRVIGEIVAGILLGPSLLGAVWPEAVGYLFADDVVAGLRVLASLGLVLFMFLIGLELDLTQLPGQRTKAFAISHVSIALPMLLGGILGVWLHPRFAADTDAVGFSLFLGTAMAVTAFPVLARVLQETGLSRTRLGTLTLTCAAIDDVTAWGTLAVVVAIVDAGAWTDVARTVVLTVAFIAVMWTVVRRALARLADVPVWLAISLALLAAWVTEQIGIHPIFGAFLAGTALPRRAHLQLVIRDQIESPTLTLLLPVFFMVVGLSTRIDALGSVYLWAVTAGILAVAICGKFVGSTLTARVMGESWRDAASIGVLMNTRGLTELVILSVGLDLGLLSTTMFTMMVLVALVTTFMAPPLLGLLGAARLVVSDDAGGAGIASSKRGRSRR